MCGGCLSHGRNSQIAAELLVELIAAELLV